MTNPPSFGPQKLYSIQALRGFAALLVLVFHVVEVQRLYLISAAAKPEDIAHELDLLRGFWMQGYAGVDLFFVISGFIMVYITQNQTHGVARAWTFLKARFARIYPLWWLICLLIIGQYLVRYHLPYHPENFPHGQNLLGYFIKSFLLIPQHTPPVLGQGWTLIHEMFFYFGFALLLLFPKAYRFPGLMIWGCITICLAALGFATNEAYDYLTLLAHPLTLEFLAGAGLGFLINNKWEKYPKQSVWLGLILLVIAMVSYTAKDIPMMIWGRVLVYTAPFALLLYGLVTRERQGTLKVPLSFVRLGDWSYSLYLSHILVLGVLMRFWHKMAASGPAVFKPVFSIGHRGVLDNVSFAAVGILASILCAYVLYTVFERPVMGYFHRNRRKSCKTSSS